MSTYVHSDASRLEQPVCPEVLPKFEVELDHSASGCALESTTHLHFAASVIATERNLGVVDRV